ncbi:tripartite tricarboxylate transporter substrate binding protein [Roseomonas sp. OT10]|uniref:Bug family tripartite tricarboxylate transporter substrate binding protein n=1 Tax=Roseomonas cutis TaxID=2897332 RepID=UPI001E2B1D29|nr:tripartite tricarboxylate transporter substrate binding protein [Roseomonas sp. OT10]UFN50415.1 tripartite tricarboxylate transporter substrate binding protein [Roseomonas sp. OT10]
MTHTLRQPGRRALLGLAGAALLSRPGLAQGAWPERGLTLIVPFAPGGATDMIGRLVADRLSPRLGRPVVVENRPGGAANIGVAALARSAPDGYTIGIVSLTTFGLNPWLYRDRLPFDPVGDFAFISNGATTPNVLVVNPRKVPAGTLQELVAWLRDHPGQANYGSSGAGTAIHVAMEMFLAAAGVKATHVPYRGSGPMMTDLVGGQIDLAIDAASVAWPHVQSGALRAVATTGAERASFSPDLPTLAETWPQVVIDPWHGFAAPAGTPRPVVERLSREIQAVLREPQTEEKMRQQVMVPRPMDPAAFTAFVAAERARYGAVIERANIRVD